MRISVEMKWGLVLLFVMVDEINDAIADPSTADWTKWLVLVNNRFWQDGAIEEIQTGKPGRDWMLLTPARFVTSFSRSVLVERRRRTFWSRSDRTRLLALRIRMQSQLHPSPKQCSVHEQNSTGTDKKHGRRLFIVPTPTLLYMKRVVLATTARAYNVLLQLLVHRVPYCMFK